MPSSSFSYVTFSYPLVLYIIGSFMPRLFASFTAHTISGIYCPGVTRLILFAPLSASSIKISLILSLLITFPAFPSEISLFWQNTQCRLQPEKKMPHFLFFLICTAPPSNEVLLAPPLFQMKRHIRLFVRFFCLCHIFWDTISNFRIYSYFSF